MSIRLTISGGVLLASIACLGLLLASERGSGAVVAGLYDASVPVSSRQDERERNRAFSAALEEVLMKVTGMEIADAPLALRRALNNPASYVDSWVYRTPPAEPDRPDAASIMLDVSFFESEILALLNANDIPLWPANRPETLIWVVVQDELGERRVLGGDAGGEIIGRIRALARERGLPLLFPLLDFADQRALGPNRLWELDEEALRTASERYQTESVLAVRLYRSLSGELLGRSLYLFRDSTQSHDSFEAGLDEFLGESLGLVARELSGYYAVLLSGLGSGVTVNLRIDGIGNPKDYAAVLSYLNGLNGINAYHLSRFERGTMMLELDTGGQIPQLVDTMALDERLEAMDAPSRDGDRVVMHYRWIGQ